MEGGICIFNWLTGGCGDKDLRIGICGTGGSGQGISSALSAGGKREKTGESPPSAFPIKCPDWMCACRVCGARAHPDS